MKQPSAGQISNLTQKIVASDRQAFDRLFRMLYPELVRYTYRYVRSKATAGDIVQDAFVKVWQKRRELDPEGSVKAYLYRTVRNRALNYLRDHSKETLGLEKVTLEQPSDEEIDNEREDSSEELWILLKEWINELPKRQREAFELSRFEGLDHEEVAEVMGVSPNTVNNHIVAALDTLRSCYDEYHKEIGE